jgi:hypothetical protein
MSFVSQYVSFMLHLAIIAALVLLYLLPSVARRWTKGKWNGSQFFLNLLTGWTIYGWWLAWETRRPSGLSGARPWHPYRTAFLRALLTMLICVVGFFGWIFLTETPSSGKMVITVIPPSQTAGGYSVPKAEDS